MKAKRMREKFEFVADNADRAETSTTLQPFSKKEFTDKRLIIP